MCGPLMLALPAPRGGGLWRTVARRLAYHAGRVGAYGALGLVFGLLGAGLAVAGVQRGVSVTMGAVMLAGVLLRRVDLFRLPVPAAGTWIKTTMGRLLRSHGWGATTFLGFLNGLLPCGLVYVAGLAAATTGGVQGAIGYMLLFGLGTVPVMFGIGMMTAAVQPRLRLKLQKAAPVCVALVGLLLIVRGLGLGIPYLSPDLSAGAAASCH